MNRRQKIIVSVTGIFLVLLLLVGLTYAYFLTRINGNTNTKSISVKAANLALVYGDGNGVLEVGEVLSPGDTVKFKTAGGDTVDKKTFSVTNQGNAKTDYVVVIEDVSVTYAETIEVDGVTQTAGSTTTFESNDFVYTLTCTSNGEACNGVDTEVTFPITGGILVGNSIEAGKTHTYSLTVTYKDTGIDQSADMNKKLEAKVNIMDINTLNPYSSDETLLAYNIINNAITVTTAEKEAGYAELVSTPPTKVASEISGETESVISATQDEYGTSYYYRGAVKNNYLSFNNMCWRIVRIEGDGAIKILLADATASCSTATLAKTDSAYIGTGDYGYTTNSNNKYLADYENSANRTSSMKYKFNIFLNGGTFKSYDLSDWSEIDKTYTAWSEANLAKLKSTTACIGDTTNVYNGSGVLMTEAEKQAAISHYDTIYYKNYVRLGINKYATLMCEGEKTSETKISPLTADEVVLAGGKVEASNYTYYLRENATTNYWWTLSPSGLSGDGDYASDVDYSGSVVYSYVSGDYVNLRPAVSLVSGVKIANGDGSIENPYIVN